MLQSNMHARLFAFANTRRHLMLSKEAANQVFLVLEKSVIGAKIILSALLNQTVGLTDFIKTS